MHLKMKNWQANISQMVIPKGLERPRLIGLTGVEFKHAWTTTKACASCVEAIMMIISKEYAPLGA